MRIKVVIVEDDPQVSTRLAWLISASDGLSCVGQYSSAEIALQELPKSQLDVVLMDIQLPHMNGVECTRRLREMQPELLIVMLTAFENTSMIFSALSAGACGYLLKRSSPVQIIAAIHEAHNGGSPMSSGIARRLVSLFRDADVLVEGYARLSLREQQVLDHLARGYTYHEIGDYLAISYTTVHTHIRHIYKKLQVHSRMDAVGLHMRYIAGHEKHVKSARVENFEEMSVVALNDYHIPTNPTSRSNKSMIPNSP